jgi:hypothetical protein
MGRDMQQNITKFLVFSFINKYIRNNCCNLMNCCNLRGACSVVPDTPVDTPVSFLV